MISPDKHKTSAEEGVLCLQQRLAYDLEGLGVVAGQEKSGGRLIREKLGHVRRRRWQEQLRIASTKAPQFMR
ncbi:Uncharacterised protein [Bacillus freudenreichii]|nr:Uncharacterised protein [Bacillus freudenreichii]